MIRLAVRRLLQLPLILLVVYTITVLLLMAKPGNPLDTGERPPTEAALRAKARRYGFDRPWYERYFWRYPHQLLIDRSLPSLYYQDWTVTEIITTAFGPSAQIGAFALAVALPAGTIIGVLAAVRRNRLLDHLSLALALIGVSLPAFVIAELALLVVGVWWRLLPVGGWGRPSQLILPGLTLSLPFMAYIARLMRAAMLDVLRSDYIRTARAKGLAGHAVVLRHAFANAFLPVLSFLGPAAAGALTGSFVVEKIFNVPGMGEHFVNAVLNGDQTLALGVVMLYSSLLVTFNLIVDLLYAVIDPRIRLQQ